MAVNEQHVWLPITITNCNRLLPCQFYIFSWCRPVFGFSCLHLQQKSTIHSIKTFDVYILAIQLSTFTVSKCPTSWLTKTSFAIANRRHQTFSPRGTPGITWSLVHKKVSPVTSPEIVQTCSNNTERYHHVSSNIVVSLVSIIPYDTYAIINQPCFWTLRQLHPVFCSRCRCQSLDLESWPKKGSESTPKKWMVCAERDKKKRKKCCCPNNFSFWWYVKSNTKKMESSQAPMIVTMWFILDASGTDASCKTSLTSMFQPQTRH